jgi:hypothetical protein
VAVVVLIRRLIPPQQNDRRLLPSTYTVGAQDFGDAVVHTSIRFYNQAATRQHSNAPPRARRVGECGLMDLFSSSSAFHPPVHHPPIATPLLYWSQLATRAHLMSILLGYRVLLGVRTTGSVLNGTSRAVTIRNIMRPFSLNNVPVEVVNGQHQ